MNPGYIAIWIIICAVILFSTGWKPLIAPGVNRRSFVLLLVAVIALLPFPLWSSVMPQFPNLELHAAVYLLLIAGGATLLRSKEEWSYKGYMLLCIAMIALIWGTIRRIYSVDPVFYWLEPTLDTPLLAGALVGAFASRTELQFGILIWGAALGEMINAVLQGSDLMARIGSVSWWDSFCMAMAAAFFCSQLLKLARTAFAKVVSYCSKLLAANR